MNKDSYAVKTLALIFLKQLIDYVDESLLVMTWVDGLDISVMAVFLCLALVFVQRRTSWTILLALFPMVITFIAAKILRMYLTTKVFQMGLTALSVSIVIIFQEDFRRAFESLSSWRLWKRRDSLLSAKVSETLLECLATFGSSKTGALIVIAGRQPLEAYLRAGISVQGQVSGPLLKSIFDPSSPGHDGAVIIINEVLDRFGAHLPLSRNSEATGRLGTRHAAALGLAEKSDALILVVSEETGTISIARNGQLQAAKSMTAVRDAIRDQFRRLRPLPHRSVLEIPWARLAASFLLSFFLWSVFARPANLGQTVVEVPITFQGLAEAWEVKTLSPAKLKLTLIGAEGSLLAIQPANLPFSLNLAHVKEGQQTFAVTDSQFRLPPRTRLKRIEPAVISVEAYRTIDRSVPVSLIWLKPEERNPGSSQVQVTPPLISLRIPHALAPPKFLETEPVDGKELRRNGKLKVKLRLPADAQVGDKRPPEVEITFLPQKP